MPKLPGLTSEAELPPVAELSAKPPQTPQTPSKRDEAQSQAQAQPIPAPMRPAMDDPEDDPWNSPELHKGHDHAKSNGGRAGHATTNGHGGLHDTQSTPTQPSNLSQYSAAATPPQPSTATESHGGEAARAHEPGWGFYGGSTPGANNFANPHEAAVSPFAADGGAGRNPERDPIESTLRSSGRTGSGVEENVLVTLLPGKEGLFMFQHHNYEVSSQRRGSKVVRRYSDFVWLLDCLHKRYPFRVLPLLPPKRVAVNGNHLSNDGGFIEKRRRGLARFLNAVVRHPMLSQEQLVVMFLTVPTVRLTHRP